LHRIKPTNCTRRQTSRLHFLNWRERGYREILNQTPWDGVVQKGVSIRIKCRSPDEMKGKSSQASFSLIATCPVYRGDAQIRRTNTFSCSYPLILVPNELAIGFFPDARVALHCIASTPFDSIPPSAAVGTHDDTLRMRPLGPDEAFASDSECCFIPCFHVSARKYTLWLTPDS
jgi:hypothetical protein